MNMTDSAPLREYVLGSSTVLRGPESPLREWTLDIIAAHRTSLISAHILLHLVSPGGREENFRTVISRLLDDNQENTVIRRLEVTSVFKPRGRCLRLLDLVARCPNLEYFATDDSDELTDQHLLRNHIPPGGLSKINRLRI